VKEFHPDGTHPDPEEFKRVVEAFNVIQTQRAKLRMDNPDAI
jgi:hypothetical protein